MRYSSKSSVFAVAVLLSGAAVFGSACGGSGSDDRGSSAAGAPSVTAGSPGSSGTSASAGAGGGSASCDSSTMCCATMKCTCPYPQGAAASPVIANMEDGMVKFKTATVMTAAGYWDFSRDMSAGTVMPAGTSALTTVDGGANGTLKALHVTGTNLTGWGAALAAELANGCSFDASNYGGISFYAKGTSTVLEGANKLLVLVGNPEYIPQTQGGFCDEAGKDPNCYARHRVTIDLTPEWKQYIIAWEDLKAPAYLMTGKPFGANRIRDIVFNASGPSPDPMPAASFDFSVDELKFEPVGVKGNITTSTGGAGTGAGGESSMGGAGGASAAGASGGAGGASAGAGGASAGAGGAPAGAGGA